MYNLKWQQWSRTIPFNKMTNPAIKTVFSSINQKVG